MALFSRSLKPGDAASAATGDAQSENGPRHTIGELLRETRQSYGGDIDRIAATLRIRGSYLSAIEQNQYDKLPGPVYAQGFVRAYAVHLGLDGDEAIRRFKQEVAGFEVSRDLSFPVPLAERSIPGGTMVLAALILAICGYGLWYYVSTSDRSHPERVSAVPPDLIAAAQKPAPPSETPATSAPAPAPVAAAPALTPPATVAPPSPSPPSTVAAAPAAPAAAPSIAAPAPNIVAPAPPISPLSTPAAPAQTASPVTAPSLSAAPPAAPTQTASLPATAASPSADANAPGAAVQQPRVYGSPPDVPARIVVHAIKDSWVQIRSGEDVLVQRTLHPGDTIRVPDESGLSLRTGNGAGIQLEVDGKLGRPMSGMVRTVVLDANRLSASGGNVPTPRAEISQ